MVLIYDILFTIFMILYLPVFVVKLRQADDKKRLISDRLGILSPSFCEKIRGRDVIWVHAVSVGEVIAAQPFLRLLHERFPHYQIVLSTVTPTGNRVAFAAAHSIAEVFYVPLDISWITRRVIKIIQPKLLVLMETELWPNLIIAAKHAGAHIAIANGRLSPPSFRSYYKVKRFVRGAFDLIDSYCVQTDKYAKRLRKMGISEEKIAVLGNMKFDSVSEMVVKDTPVEHLKRTCGIRTGGPVIIGASTHKGEEVVLATVFLRLKQRYPGSTLVLVPRHIERTPEIVTLVQSLRLSCMVRDTKTFTGKQNLVAEGGDVLVVNTIGELKQLYPIGDVVFMGGSLICHGGQNPLEALAYKKPVVTGPFVFNFEDIYKNLRECGAALMVDSDASCYQAFSLLLASPVEAAQRGTAGHAWLSGMKGASERTVEVLRPLLETTV